MCYYLYKCNHLCDLLKLANAGLAIADQVVDTKWCHRKWLVFIREYITKKISVGALSWLSKNMTQISRVKKKELSQEYIVSKDKWCNGW